MNDTFTINSISSLNKVLELERPAHPLITVFHHSQLKSHSLQGRHFCFELFMVSLKDGATCKFGYGHTRYDFDEGTMAFMAPGQTIAIEQIEPSDRAFGWTIAFHPDLIRNSEMGRKIEHYNFFHYDTNEALHLSAREVRLVADIAANIELECGNNLDRHSQMLIQSNLELLLKYSERFYDRQFYVRRDLNRDHLNRLNAFLHDYYQSEQCLDKGIPSVALCGKELGLSPYYLSDLLKRETGKNALEHIHLFIIERAKSLLHDGNISITQIAYDLGFEYPQHFSKLFKAKTGLSPRAFKAQS